MNLIGCMVLGGLLASVSSAVAQEGHRQTDRLISRADRALRSIGEAKEQLQTTLEIYNSIFEGGGDTRRIHRDLTRAIDRSEDRREDVRRRVADMESEAHTFFAQWMKSLDEISSESLRQRSQARLNEARVRYGEILTEGRTASAMFEPLMGALRDQVVFLGHDLNPSAIASLKPDAEKLNAQAESLLSGIERTQRKISGYIASLKPSE